MDAFFAERAERVYATREELMEHFEGAFKQTFEGLSVAARAAKRRGMLDARLVKAVERLDVTYHVLRHFTRQRSKKLIQDICSPTDSPRRNRDKEQQSDDSDVADSAHRFEARIFGKKGKDNEDDCAEVQHDAMDESGGELTTDEKLMDLKDILLAVRADILGLAGPSSAPVDQAGNASQPLLPVPAFPLLKELTDEDPYGQECKQSDHEHQGSLRKEPAVAVEKMDDFDGALGDEVVQGEDEELKRGPLRFDLGSECDSEWKSEKQAQETENEQQRSTESVDAEYYGEGGVKHKKALHGMCGTQGFKRAPLRFDIGSECDSETESDEEPQETEKVVPPLAAIIDADGDGKGSTKSKQVLYDTRETGDPVNDETAEELGYTVEDLQAILAQSLIEARARA